MSNFDKNLQEMIFNGTLRCNEKGFGFVTTKDGEFFISPINMGQALNGDNVTIRKLFKRNDDDRAEIIRVNKRGITKLVGSVFSERGIFYVRPDDRAYFSDIYIGSDSRIQSGDKVFVSLEKFPKNRCPEGKIIQIIGKQFELRAEEEAVILSKQIEENFSREAQSFAQTICGSICEKDFSDRLDLSGQTIFTIDGETAKDFDDAVSLTVENDIYNLGVHIADVSHYVTQGSVLDKEAFSRGTSVYFPDRVIPMLPFELSNGICSLVEGESRLTVSVFVKLNKKGEILNSEIRKTIIKSTHRLTYTIVDKIIDGDIDSQKAYEDIADTLLNMDKLRALLEKKRKKLGYINIDVKESEINIDGDGITVAPHKATRATRLIEQFMILANEVVAEYLYYGNVPAIYRVHDKPTDEKLTALKNLLKVMGINVNWRKDEIYPSDFSNLLDRCRNGKAFPIVNKIVLKSMQKAKYSPRNIGHFGLASKCYCHFTSPIRRYPDLVVHRILKLTLSGEIVPLIDLYEDFCMQAAEKSSEKERLAEEAEREVDKLYKVRFMANHIGENFIGSISFVNSDGFFVELDNTCEGFLPIELLPAGRYTFDKNSMRLTNGRKKYEIGDRLKVCVISADFLTGRIDLALAK